MIEPLTFGSIGKYIPLDKSWTIRHGILDLTRGYSQDITNFLDTQPQQELGNDLKSLRKVISGWPERYSKPLDVGESGTIYRFVKFYNWMNKISIDPLVSKTLIERSKNRITNNPEIINYTPEQLRELDNQTSQWATMQYLLETPEKRRKSMPILERNEFSLEDIDFALRLTYKTVPHWESQRNEGKMWIPQKDFTIFNQAIQFVQAVLSDKMFYIGEQPEDYCFERAFNLIDEKEGRQKYPSVAGHEKNRFEEMERVIQEADKSGIIDSADHRVVQSMVMRQLFLKKSYEVINPEVVNKTWPRFWNFIEFVVANV